MPRVRGHYRRNGSRVRGHYRKRPARRTARRDAAAVGLVVGGLLLVVLLATWVRRNPGWAALIGGLAVAAAVAVLALVLWERRRRTELNIALARQIETTDLMSGPQFEHWVAALLAGSGFTGVRVRGGSGDRGVDILATTFDGRRAVVQCKRRSVTNRVGSAAIQQFNGTCRRVHHGELCMIVTNGYFTDGDGRRFAAEEGIVLVDRDALARWAYTRVPPPAVAG
ncbi:restriction endonuclease [Solwaraspora sp. WMMB335]|uniref:restriction endonuclease n=1 Tax=Solwaraspora sp. WMMB335 TaxID=3404118 RepID=UPI003B930DF7